VLASISRFRHFGRRLPDRDIENATRLRGDISLVHMDYRGFGSVDVLEVRVPNNVTTTGVIARLFEPRLVSWHGNMMLFRGFEPVEDRDGRWGVVQEWRVEMP
jgi:hypothetical protein